MEINPTRTKTTSFFSACKRLVLLACCFSASIFTAPLFAQNLVLNPSFENTSSCPQGISEFSLCTNWSTTTTASSDTCSTPDLYATCSSQIGGANVPNALLGYHQARTGTHFAGIILGDGFPGCAVLNDNYREYIEGQLSTPLVAGQKYQVQFYMSLADASMWASNSVGVNFTNTQYTHNACPNSIIPLAPQLNMCGPAITDSINWIPVQWVYTATGGEQYFTIGNFKSDANTNRVVHNCNSFNPYIYYYIEDVSIIPITVATPNICGVSLALDSVNPSCGSTNGSVKVTATGCTTPFTYAWSSGGVTTPTLSNVGPGTYTVTVTDVLNCHETVSVHISSVPILLTDSATYPTCGSTNGSATVIVKNASGSYTYAWSPGSGTTSTITGLGAGTYHVTVTGAPGCTATDSVSVLGSSTVSLTMSSTAAGCSTGNVATATATPTGGTPPYSYLWSNGQTTQTATGLAAGTYTVSVHGDTTGAVIWSEDFTNATGWTLNTAGSGSNAANANQWVINNDNTCVCGSGKYLHITCNGNAFPCFGQGGTCTYLEFPNGTGFGSFTTDVMAVTPVISTVGKTNMTLKFSYMCEGTAGADYGLVRLSSNGGTTWTDLPTQYQGVSTCTPVSLSIPAAYQNNANFRIAFRWINAAGLGGNDPGFVIDDVSLASAGSNCPAVGSVTIAVSGGLSVVKTAQKNVSCFGGSDGSVKTTITGGTAPYSYTWSPNVSTTDSAKNLSAGIYTVTITDANGCTGLASFLITQPNTGLSAANTVSPAACGTNTGKIVLSVSGGTPSYSYIWSPNVSTVDSAQNLAAGTYNITVTDFKNCSVATAVTVAPTGGITVTAGVKKDVSCFGAGTGIAHVTVTGGTTPYTYTWSPNVSTVDSAVNLPAGTYAVTVHDANNCSGTVSVTIAQPAAALAVTNTATQATCGNNNGKIVLAVTGGTSTYSYTWSPNVSTVDSATALAANTYHITVTDSKSCTTVTNVVISAIPTIVVTPGIKKDVTCFGGNNGSAHVTVSGGTSPFTYTWSSNVSTNDSAVNLVAGTYTVTVRDANSCSGTASFVIGQPATALSATNTTSPAACTTSNGKVVLAVTGGTPTYSYIWSPNVSTVDSATGLAAGTYHVTITDSKACTFTVSAVVAPSTGITVSAGVKKDVSCFGASTGIAHVSVTGGTTPYTYTWSPNVSTVDSAVNLPAGTYAVTVHDANNCSGTLSITIAQPAAALAVTNTATQATCGNNNGKIVLAVTGGTSTYSYTWSPNVSTVDSATALAANTYHITVTDSKSCTTVTNVVISAIPTIVVTPGIKKDVTCFGGNNGSAHVTVSGGTSPFTYTWTSNVSTNDSAINLIAGTYTVTVRDANSCSGTASFVIGQPAAALASTSTTVPAACGNSTGKIVLNVTGGTPTYTYIWSPNVSTVDSAISLAAGTYHITITDSKSCTSTTSVTVAPSAGITVTAGIKKDVACFGGSTGSAHVTVTGGTTPYTYVWSPNVSTNDSATGLTAGTYNVTVRDVNNCSGTLTITIAQPPAALSVTSTATQTTCGNNNGKIVLNVAGGTPAYSYTWSPNVSTVDSATNLAVNTYHVTVTDANACTIANTTAITAIPGITVAAGTKTDVSCFGGNNGTANVTASAGVTPYIYTWSPNVSTTAAATNLTAGTYTVTVKDANNCTGTASFVISQPLAAIAATYTAVPASCGSSDGKVVLTVTGGTPSYTYIWSPNVSTVDSAVNLLIGTYSVTITDSKNCTLTTSAIVPSSTGFGVAQGPKTDVRCFGGSTGAAHVAVTGGTSPFTYTWSPNVSTVDSAIGLTANTYTVTVKDANNCSGVVSFTIAQPTAALAVTPVATQATCGNNNGKIVLNVTGGTPGYTYFWGTGITTDSLVNIGASTYNVTVTDAQLCTAATSQTITVSPAINVSPGTSVNVSCFGGSDGSAQVTVSGGTAPITYLWSNFAVTTSLTGISAGTYTVSVTDHVGCAGTASFLITQPLAALAVTATPVQATCGNNNGKVILAVSGGTTAYSYTWSPNVSTVDSAVSLAANTYAVTVTDAKNCTVATSATVVAAPVVTLAIASQKDVSCSGGNNGKIFLSTGASTAPYTYTWLPNVSTNDSAVSLTQGTYSVTVTDGNGCTASVSALISEPQPLAVSIATTLAHCVTSDGKATATVTGGTNPITYAWSAGGSVAYYIDSNLAAGNYTLTITDVNLCSVTTSASISNIGGPTVSIASATNDVCHGGNTGNIYLAVSAGTPAYTYTWSPNVSALDSAVHLTAGSYAVTVSDINGCVASTSTSITEPPALSFTMTSANTDCGQTDGWAKAAVTGGTGTLTYVWNSPQTTDSITGLAGGEYRVTVTDINSCTAVDSVAVGTNPGPLAPSISAGGPITFCQGDSVILTSSVATGNTWSTAATTQAIIVRSSGTYTVTQTSGSCTSPASAAVVVTVNPIPATPVITASGPLSFCPGGSVTLTSSAATGDTWSTGATTQAITVSEAGSFTVSTIQLGCPSAVSAPAVVSIIPTPQPHIVASQLSICPGDSATLDATTAGASAYAWSSGATQPVIGARAAGSYQVTVTVNGCTGSDQVTIGANPVLGSLSLPDSFSVCTGDTVTLDATTANAATYQWSVGAATTPVVTVETEGVYYVTVSNNCGSLTDSVLVSIQSCECKMVMGNAFTPNDDGKNDFFMPNFLCKQPTSMSMKIYDRWGGKVYETEDLTGKWDGSYNGTPQADGVYIYIIEFTGLENHKDKTVKMVGTVTLIR